MQSRRFERFLRTFGALLLIGLAAGVYVRWRNIREVIRQTERTLTILEDANRLLSALKDAETGQRGYLLTGDVAYLKPYVDVASAIPVWGDKLVEAVGEDPRQADLARRIRETSRQKLSELDRTIALRRDKGLDAALEVVNNGAGLREMNQARAQMSELMDYEYRRRVERLSESERLPYRNLLFNWVGLSILGLILALYQKTVNRGFDARERLAAELDQARQRLEITLMSIGDGVIACDASGRVTLLNPMAEKLTGWREHDAANQPVQEVFRIVNEDTRDDVESPVAKVLRTGQLAGLANHTILIDKQGNDIPIDDSGAPIRDKNGGVLGVVLVFRDIAQRRQQEQLIEKWYRIFRDAGFAVALLDSEGKKILEANEAFAKIYGYETGEMHGKPLKDLAPDESVFQGTEDRTVRESLHRRKDGKLFYVLTDVTISRNPKGQPVYRVVYSDDISDRRRVEDNLRESDERFRSLVTALPQLVWSSNAEGDLEYSNALWDAYLGPGREGFGKAEIWSRIVHPEDADAYQKGWNEARESGKLFEYQCRLKHVGDGSYRWFLCRAVPLLGHDQKIVRWLGTCSDIDDQVRHSDELKRANESLRRSNDDLEQFAYAASHDLQEPLRMISLYTQLLKEEYGGQLDDTAQSYVDFAVNGVRRMERLLQDLLAYSRVVTASPEHEAETADAAAAAAAALENLHAIVRKTEAHIHVGPLPQVRIPFIRLTQLLQNIVSNALKYGGAQPPEVSVEAEPMGSYWRFSIQDNGIGIEEPYLDQVFGVFKRLHGSEYEGTGIGLAICQRIVERYGGRIWVESKGTNKGSTFFFTLPASVSGGQPTTRSGNVSGGI